jgi:hypothetical protein
LKKPSQMSKLQRELEAAPFQQLHGSIDNGTYVNNILLVSYNPVPNGD